MPTFQYKALQGNGRHRRGQSSTLRGAIRSVSSVMEGRGLRPISLAEHKNGKSIRERPRRTARRLPAKVRENDKANGSSPGFQLSLGNPTKISARALENFTRLLSSLLAAGVPLSRALVILTKEAPIPSRRRSGRKCMTTSWTACRSRMRWRNRRTRSRVLYVAMVEAGETGGFLDVVLAQIADFQAREKEMKSKVMTALLYPHHPARARAGVCWCSCSCFFIPKFQTIFTGFGAKLPLLTQIIVGTSEIMRSYGLIVLLVIAAGWVHVANVVYVREAGTPHSWEGMILRAPVVGPLVSQFAMSRFCRMLGTLLGAGVPLINALNVARRSIGNQVLVDAVSNSIERVKEGKQLGPSLGDCRTPFRGLECSK